ncbi:uncharacterized protein EV420DRAFT_1487396 [Desarmillaria tabescens]|uniref:Uncharacterized protein n=1 Tax=Armillaria tabescens TaxID=1929756 RepID=A0AA39MJ60_ARMTA|nr:uncharacterized protein EV420DRAFT_1487396 [Desarmillaria tabescens]KAK0436846.1 hypothetical protein EV420DRAFT_1487396 [Desarmillaria tabescens]
MMLKPNVIEAIVDLQNKEIMKRVGAKHICQGLLFGTHCFMPKLVHVETHMRTHCIGDANFHPERWLQVHTDDNGSDHTIGGAKILKRTSTIRWAMYFIRDQKRTLALQNRQLSPYLLRTGPRFKGNVLVVKVHNLTGGEDIQVVEIEWLQKIMITALAKEMNARM